MFSLNGSTAPVMSCPQCSILVEGTCVICAEGDPHPSCQYCQGGTYKPPWHQHPMTNAIITSVVVAVISGLILRQLSKQLHIGE